MRCLDDRDQQRRPHRPDAGDLFQQLASCILATFGDQLTPSLLAQGLEEIQLLIQSLGSSPQTRFSQLLQALVAATLAIHALARTANRHAVIYRLNAVHYSGHIPRQY
jgi:hypothetical protein